VFLFICFAIGQEQPSTEVYRRRKGCPFRVDGIHSMSFQQQQPPGEKKVEWSNHLSSSEPQTTENNSPMWDSEAGKSGNSIAIEKTHSGLISMI
jgi:hypothetical protein